MSAGIDHGFFSILRYSVYVTDNDGRIDYTGYQSAFYAQRNRRCVAALIYDIRDIYIQVLAYEAILSLPN